MSVRARFAEPALTYSSQRLVEDTKHDTVTGAVRVPGRPDTRQTRNHSIDRLEFLPMFSLTSSVSVSSVASPILLPLSSASGSRFTALLHHHVDLVLPGNAREPGALGTFLLLRYPSV